MTGMLAFEKSTRKMRRNRIPGQVVIQITNRCNALCPQCGMRRSAAIQRASLPDTTVRRILDACSVKGVQAVSFTGGEPLLMLDRVVEWIVHAGRAGIPFIRSDTNGFLFSETIRHRFTAKASNPKDPQLRFAHFTDTFYEVNGVAKSLQQQAFYAHKHHKAYTIVTCRTDSTEDQPGICNFEPIGTYKLPEYPEQKIFYPPLLEMLAYCFDGRINHIHCATPGPVGLAALAIAKILKLPVSGTYHTAIPQYAKILTEDDSIEDLTWKFVLWFYDQMDLIYALSESTKAERIAKGIRPEKIKCYPRGIDIDVFHPSKRNGVFKKNLSSGRGP